jgi:hypothetical protein
MDAAQSRRPDGVVRSKRFVLEEERSRFHNHVGRSFETGPFEDRQPRNKIIYGIVFIRRAFETEDFLEKFGIGG